VGALFVFRTVRAEFRRSTAGRAGVRIFRLPNDAARRSFFRRACSLNFAPGARRKRDVAEAFSGSAIARAKALNFSARARRDAPLVFFAAQRSDEIAGSRESFARARRIWASFRIFFQQNKEFQR
jgi:hypothetical protein